jgi:hypothetical protein
LINSRSFRAGCSSHYPFWLSIAKNPGLTTDLDLIIVWDAPLGFLERTGELHRRLQPRVATDLLVYTPNEMEWMVDTPLVRGALE